MTRFSKLDPSLFKGGTVILDIDGTLMAHSGTMVAEEERSVIADMQNVARTYLFSNRPTAERNKRLAESLGVPLISTEYKKPDPRVLREIMHHEGPRFVVGDKVLTDGLLALFTNSTFVHIERMPGKDGALDRILYRTDDLATKLWFAARWIFPYVMLLRPHQWIKNALVFAPVFFAGALFSSSAVIAACAAFVTFSFAASGVYVLNDIFDREQDRAHPRKRFRPIAAGRVSVPHAYSLVVLMGILCAGILVVYPVLAPVVLLYVVLNIAYTLGLKHVVFFDIPLVSAFYVLRIIAGGEATGEPLSYWILACTFFGAAILTIGKRLAEYTHTSRRRVLAKYSPWFLRAAVVASACGAVATYVIWSVFASPTPFMGYSSIFVATALYRVVSRLIREGGSETPEWFVFKDRVVVGAFVGWAVYGGVVLYLI